jgi:serine/threonine-protein kinase HipA
MMRMSNYPELEVYLYGKKVGTLFDDGVAITFLYSKIYRSMGVEFSPIKLNTKDIKGRYINSDHKAYHGLPGVIADSLPDSNGSAIMDRYFEALGLNPNLISILHKLAFIGDRGMGALEYRPKQRDIDKTSIDIVSIKDIRDKEKALRCNKDTTIDELLSYIVDSVSPVGGAKDKMLIYYNKDTKGLKFYSNSSAYAGYEAYIIKFDDESKCDTLNEYLYMNMARMCGIDTCECELYSDGNLKHYMAKRFDRVGNKKIHLATASALLHKPHAKNALSYEELFRLTYKITNSIEQVKQMIRRMVFNYLTCVSDDHSKNFSYMMDESGKWSISPAYDVIYGLGVGALKHKSTLRGKNEYIHITDVISVASEYSMSESEVKSIVDDILSVLNEFEIYADGVGIKSSDRDAMWYEIRDRVRYFVSGE